ncbi:hypothetical protein HNQ91_005664 [Filimonas zeae]|uniref:Uncharacterized protein n=1 Tax=Filimonas zeae TaxID=1737353 RepID=A0A917MZ38_9BACT|nr:hypothetical protein [Filimonas zeae]MDR6342580.1 hypothetical protein [Filimonas zeae]GGH81882.1 hypothetical protein GCM10011379_54940 [Filimonas zeae]
MLLPDLNKTVLLIAAFLVSLSGSAQIKIGTSPTVLEKSALLELNGNRQGLLLPRLTDTTIINTLTPPDGMLIYFQPTNSGRGLYLRKSGYWQRITTDSVLAASLNSWNLTGNNGLTGTEKLGPLNAVGLNLITANTNRLTIDATGNISLLGNTTAGGTFSLNPATTATDVTALLLNSGNTVVKRNLNAVAFTGAIQSINSLTASAQTLQTTATPGSLGFISSGSTHTLSIPDADASNRGFVNTLAQTFAGNKTFGNNLTVSGITTLSPLLNTADTSFLMINASNQVTRRNFSSFPGIQNLNGLTGSTQSFATSGNQTAFAFSSSGTTHTLNIPDADGTLRGFVNTGTQTFAGNKTYSGNIAVNGTTTLSSALSNTDTSFLMVNASNVVVKRNLSTLPLGIQSINSLTAPAQTLATNATAGTLGFNSTGSTHTLTLPDASISARGFVNTAAQSFAGNKTFTNNLTVSGVTALTPALNTSDTTFLMINASNQVTSRNFSSFAGIHALNGLTAPVQTFATSFSQAPLAFNSLGTVHTLNFPDADATYRGLVNIGTQSFSGNKTFANNLTVSGTTTLAGANSATDTIFLMTNLTNSQVERRNITSLPFIQSINTLTAPLQTINTSNTPGPLAFTSSSSTHTLAIPDADASTRGFVNTGTQTIAGAKTLNSTLIVNNTGATGSSGLTLPKLTSATAETSGARSIGVDASGVVVRTPTAPTYYNSAGATTITKVWIGQLTTPNSPSNTGVVSFNITSAGFTSLANVQVSVQKNAATAAQIPYASVTTSSTSSVTVAIIKGTTNLLGLSSTTVLDTDASITVYLRVEGN